MQRADEELKNKIDVILKDSKDEYEEVPAAEVPSLKNTPILGSDPSIPILEEKKISALSAQQCIDILEKMGIKTDLQDPSVADFIEQQFSLYGRDYEGPRQQPNQYLYLLTREIIDAPNALPENLFKNTNNQRPIVIITENEEDTEDVLGILFKENKVSELQRFEESSLVSDMKFDGNGQLFYSLSEGRGQIVETQGLDLPFPLYYEKSYLDLGNKKYRLAISIYQSNPHERGRKISRDQLSLILRLVNQYKRTLAMEAEKQIISQNKIPLADIIQQYI